LEPESDLWLEAILLRSLDGQDLVQVFFRVEVLDRYTPPDYTLVRSNTAGRLRKAGGFSLDFGLAADDRLIHVSLADLRTRLPAAERPHWVKHAVSLPYSRNFLQMQLRPGSCFDDGDTRPWRRGSDG
jgi:hypothetical protein